MKIKIAFILAIMFSLASCVNASQCCNPSGNDCHCATHSSCTFTCNSGWYNCDGNDANGCESSTPCNQYSFQRYTFNLSSYTLSNIKSITYCFKGYYYWTGVSGAAVLQHYNVTSGSWVNDQSLDGSLDTFCNTFTDVSDLLNNSMIFQFALRGYTGTSDTVNIYTDNANLSFAYGTSGTLVWTTGKFNNALSFDGSGTYATAPDSPSLDISGALTVEAWVKPNTVTPIYQTIVQKSNSTSEDYGLFLNASDVYFEGGGITNSLKTTSANLQPNTWYHIAAVLTYPGSITIYINGVQNATASTNNNLATNTANLQIGNNQALVYPFNGTIDEVAIYSRAKSASEIYADANSMYVSLNLTDPLGTQLSIRNATSGYINPGANNTFYIKTNNNGNLNMTVGGYAGTYSLRMYIQNVKANLALQIIENGVSSIRAILPIQLQVYNQLFKNMIISNK